MLKRPPTFASGQTPAAWPMLVTGVVFFAVWAAATWAWHVAFNRYEPLPEYLFRLQDLPVLIGFAVALVSLVPLDRKLGPGAPPLPPPWAIMGAAVAALVVARLGRDLVFHGYAPSRDEVMVEVAARYLADGHIGWPIPPEWQPYARAIMPEFVSPYGADTVWTSVYLPVHSAIRALFERMGDADLAGPIMLGIGLIALWDVARYVFPKRPDARLVVMLMALTSAQLIVTAMSPYAMTSHFALNLVWLALILRGGPLRIALAAIVLILAAGLHQWHFPLLFMGPMILWLLMRRRWAAGLVQLGAAGAAVLVWSKLWPMLLAHLLGPPVGGQARGAPDVDDKVISLFRRLDRWQPLLNIARLIAWNDILLLPLAAMAAGRLPRSVREWLRHPPLFLALIVIVLIGFATALYQGYGWGFRYMHGSLGALCLLAGYGWTVLSPDGKRPMRLVWAGGAISLVAAAWQIVTTEGYVRPYARVMAAMRGSGADAVLVDLRGGFFMNDLVRFRDGRPGKPFILALNMMTERGVDSLCRDHDVAVMDRAQFWALGVHPVGPYVRESAALDALRAQMRAAHCGRPVIGSR